MTRWLPIRYRDFYDVPRAIVVEFEGEMYLLDCLFDYNLDDYEAIFKVYRVPGHLGSRIDEISWIDLGHRSELVGWIETNDIQFDKTKTRAIHSRSFDRLHQVNDPGLVIGPADSDTPEEPRR